MLRVSGLRKYFPVTGGFLKKVLGFVKAVDEVDFAVDAGEVFSIVGESGSGKTTLAKTIVGIYRPTAGNIVFDDRNLSKLEGGELKTIRREIQMVFQDPNSSLNPRRIVKDIIATPLDVHKIGSHRERIERVMSLLEQVELSPDEFMYRYPRGMSGGEKQRIAVARALAPSPKLIVLDEPTSALDVSVQAKILKLLNRLQEQYHLTYLLISHDLSVVRNFSRRVAVMYLGKIVEVATTEELFRNPLHPYTKVLLSSIPVVTDEELMILPEKIAIEGEIPSPFNPPQGCHFHPRCPWKMQICETDPASIEHSKNHFVSCHLYPEAK